MSVSHHYPYATPHNQCPSYPVNYSPISPSSPALPVALRGEPLLDSPEEIARFDHLASPPPPVPFDSDADPTTYLDLRVTPHALHAQPAHDAVGSQVTPLRPEPRAAPAPPFSLPGSLAFGYNLLQGDEVEAEAEAEAELALLRTYPEGRVEEEVHPLYESAPTTTTAVAAAKEADVAVVAGKAEAWEDVLASMPPVSREEVDAQFAQVEEMAEERASKVKLHCREELKKHGTDQKGTPAEISSRREAKVSRKYKLEFANGIRDALRDHVAQNLKLKACVRYLVEKEAGATVNKRQKIH